MFHISILTHLSSGYEKSLKSLVISHNFIIFVVVNKIVTKI